MEVAPRLLGTVLHKDGVAARIVEVEAYEGARDPASHAYRGVSRRNRVMFAAAGHLYVYAIHGSLCANVVCGPEGEASAVLLRAGEILCGLERARARREARRTTAVPDREVGRGPGNLVRALGISLQDYGTHLGGGGTVDLQAPDTEASPPTAPQVMAGPRVNIARAADHPWRWWLAGSRSVSAYKRHPGPWPTEPPAREPGAGTHQLLGSGPPSPAASTPTAIHPAGTTLADTTATATTATAATPAGPTTVNRAG